MRKLGYADEYGRTVYRCPEPNCYYARQVPRAELPPAHKCPEMNGTTKVGWMTYGPSLLEKTWAELDAVTARLMNPVLATNKEQDKGYAQGLAFTLSLFMAPHLTTPEDVAREAKRRWENRNNPEYCTPGLAERRYEPPPGDHKLSRIPAEKAKLSKPKPAEPALTPEQVAGIKNALGMFTAQELADMYKVSVATIESLAR
jgi:hypothetical protein